MFWSTPAAVPEGELKNVVVVGASVAGHQAANTLAAQLPNTHRVLLIERSEWVLHPPAVVRATVVPGWENKNLFAELSQDTVFPAGSRHRVVAQTSVMELRRTSVVLDKAFEGKTEIEFEKCIIATGASQPAPWRQPVGTSLADYQEMLRKMQAEIKAATKVLVVGGGAVGVETTGEINSEYPDKQVTLVHTEPKLIHPMPPPTKSPISIPPIPDHVPKSLEEQIVARGITLKLGDKIQFPGRPGEVVPRDDGQWDGSTGALGRVVSIPLASGGTVEADYIVLATGNRPNSQLVSAVDEGAVQAGLVLVDEYFRIKASRPDSPVGGEYYAVGDVAAINSSRTAVSAQTEGPALGAIVAASVKGKHPAAYHPGAGTRSMVVTLGTSGGAGVLGLGLPIIGDVRAPGLVLGMKSKDFFAAQSFYSRFKGPVKVGA